MGQRIQNRKTQREKAWRKIFAGSQTWSKRSLNVFKISNLNSNISHWASGEINIDLRFIAYWKERSKW